MWDEKEFASSRPSFPEGKDVTFLFFHFFFGLSHHYLNKKKGFTSLQRKRRQIEEAISNAALFLDPMCWNVQYPCNYQAAEDFCFRLLTRYQLIH